MNQLVRSKTGEVETRYACDAAGRFAKDDNKSYTYTWLDKITAVTEGEKLLSSFTYHMDGQIASATRADGRRESDLWDGVVRRPAAVAGTLRGPVPQSPGGLMIHRNGTEYTNEPAVTGGNPVLAGGKVLFNDLLGNTLGAKDENAYRPVAMTAFSETDNADAFFTGKPLIGNLGYAFLFRNYRAEQGKWQTADPFGYPDGWNNLAYVNNAVTMAIDWLGGEAVSSGSFNAYDLFVSKYVPYSSSLSHQMRGGSATVPYTILGTVDKHPKGISLKSLNISCDSQMFGILYYDDANGNGQHDGNEAKVSMTNIRGDVVIGSSPSTLTSKKNDDGSTTYTLTVSITLIEKVSGSYGTFTRLKELSPWVTTHTVKE